MAVDLRQIRAVLGRAYAPDPLTEWIFRDPRTRTAACAAWYGLFAETYAPSGGITWSPDERAVCLWHAPDHPPLAWPEVPTVAGLLEAVVGAEHAAAVGDALHPVADVLPTEPHVYVNFLAVEPGRQGRGAGRRAITPALEAARSAGLGVHLESTNPRNRSFFTRLGFVAGRSLALGDGPTLVTYWLSPGGCVEPAPRRSS